MSDIVVLKTSLLYEVQMLTDALKEAGIPYYQEMSNFAGVRLAMPAWPVQGPGTFYTVFVPEIAAEDAQTILAELPITADNNPGMWSFNPKPWAKKFFIAMAIISLGIWAISIIVDAI